MLQFWSNFILQAYRLCEKASSLDNLELKRKHNIMLLMKERKPISNILDLVKTKKQ